MLIVAPARRPAGLPWLVWCLPRTTCRSVDTLPIRRQNETAGADQFVAFPDAAIIASVAVSAAACSGRDRPWRESPPPPHSPPAPARLLLISAGVPSFPWGAYAEQTWTLRRGHSGPGG